MTTILVVDDSATSRMLFKAYMPKDQGLEIHEAEDAQSAMRQARAIHPDLVVLDYNLPDKNGVQIAEDLNAEGIEAKLVLLTANVQKSVLDSAKAAGILTVVEKPIRPEKLTRMLEEIKG